MTNSELRAVLIVHGIIIAASIIMMVGQYLGYFSYDAGTYPSGLLGEGG